MSSSSNEKKYSSWFNRFWLWFYWRRFFYLLDQISPPASILEVGCGEGFVLKKVENFFPQAKLAGVDMSQQALDKLAQNMPSVEIRQADVRNLPWPDNSYDLVLALEILEHVSDWLVAVAEIKRVARDKIIISVPWEPWFSWGSLVRGRYLSSWGRHPEHVNFWKRKKFVNLIDKHFRIEKTAHSFPWLLILVKKK